MLIVPSTWGCGDKRHEEHSGQELTMLTFKDCHRFLPAVTAIMGKLSIAFDHTRTLSPPLPR